MLSTGKAFAFVALVVTAAMTAACGSPLDEAHAMLDEFAERQGEIQSGLIEERAHINEMTGGIAMQRCQMYPPYQTLARTLALREHREEIERVEARQREVLDRCQAGERAIADVRRTVDTLVVNTSPVTVQATVAVMRATLSIADPDRIEDALDNSDTLIEKFEALFLLVDPTARLRVDGGVTAYNIENYDEARVERREAVETAWADINDAREEWDALQAEWEGLVDR